MSDRIVINFVTGQQVRAARGLLNWSIRELSKRADVGLTAIRRIETEKSRGKAETLGKLRRVLQMEGVELIADDGTGPGVRLRK
jgi:transcriptional regulator with XRE-family HTH domain